jgi:hypothetical protein
MDILFGQVVFPYHVQHDVVVITVKLMRMPEPVGSFYMQFNMPHPQGIFDPDLGFQEIGALVRIITTGMNDLEGIAIIQDQRLFIKILELPEVLQKPFCHSNTIW